MGVDSRPGVGVLEGVAVSDGKSDDGCGDGVEDASRIKVGSDVGKVVAASAVVIVGRGVYGRTAAGVQATRQARINRIWKYRTNFI